MKEDRERIRRLKGDGLFVQMDSNNRILEVTGDGCKITMSKNCGSVRVVGDGCLIKVKHNTGDIVYTGDGGRVLLGPKSSKENVQYFGVGGKIILDSESMNSTKNKTTKESSATLKNYLGMDKSKKIIKKTKKVDNCEPSNSDAKQTEMIYNQNCDLRNEIKEKSNCKIQNNEKEMNNAKSSATTIFVTTTTTTTTTTTNNKSGNLFEVNKWFVSPTSVVRSFVENVPTVTVYKKKASKNTTKK
ncbi:putative vacuolar protein sorting-associated protein 13B [Polistes fuscatus]|uniref:putative vacuolar protein sorting-associated protein 13B n=1 Tax=Polistes fuscatus TaxID=30207 RepID=UPI001CA8BDF0|nr:putative vacuolar protein sorting-associated protein 13B [Polistes fuscatus]